jgi:competence protein ComEA
MRLLNSRVDARVRNGRAAPERLRSLLGRVPLDDLRSPASFGAPTPGSDGAATPARPRQAPPAASLRSSPQPPDEPVETAPDAGGPEGVADRTLIGRLDPGLPGARALAVVGLLAALIAGGYLWMSRPAPRSVPEPASASLTVSSGPPAVPATPGAPGAAVPGPGATVVVHVAGKVRRPGVVTLPAGARVSEAIRAAGGLRPGAVTGSLNLARRVVDGEQIPVGVPAAAGQAAGPSPATTGGAPGTPLDLNTATLEQFQQLPGVGPVLAERIVAYRTQHGGFRGVAQLREVSGIGERRFADLRDLVRV